MLITMNPSNKQNAGQQFIEVCRKRIKSNKNLNILVVGSSGSGKSWISLALAEELDNHFNINRVCFDSQKFIENIDELEKGNVVVLEELGVNAYNRNWQSYVNKSLDHIFQTFRHKNLITICNVPDLSFIDIHLRLQFHILIIATGNIKKGQSLAKVYEYRRDYRTGKTFENNISILINGKPYELNRVWFPKPSEALRNQYETEMTVWKTKLRKDYINGEKKEFIPFQAWNFPTRADLKR